MAIDYTQLFTFMGKLVGSLNSVNTYRGTTLPARVALLDTEAQGSFPEIGEGLYPAQASARSAMNGWVNYLKSLAAAELIAEVAADRPMITRSVSAALIELNRQMLLDAEFLEDSDAAVAITPALTDGDALVVGTTLQTNGSAAQLAVPDVYNITVPTGFLGGDTPFQEFLAILGTAAVIPPTEHDWPGGSGVSTRLQVRDARNNIGLAGGRLSSLTQWINQVGGTWTVAAPTVVIRSGVSDDVFHFAPSAAAGSIDHRVTLFANTVYGWTLKVYKHASGTQDWSAQVVLADEAGTLYTSTHPSSGLTNGWNTIGGFFRTPEFMDGNVVFRIGYVDIVDESNLEMAHAGYVNQTPLYPGGPTLVAWAGTLPLTTLDAWSAEVTIGGTGALHRGMDRLLNIRSVLNFGLPVDVTATQADALVS